MSYKIRWKKGKQFFESKRTFRKKSVADAKVRFMRQIDDDLPKSKRDKYLKTYRVVKAPLRKKKKI